MNLVVLIISVTHEPKQNLQTYNGTCMTVSIYTQKSGKIFDDLLVLLTISSRKVSSNVLLAGCYTIQKIK